MRSCLSLQAKVAIVQVVTFAALLGLISSPTRGIFDQRDLSVMESGIPLNHPISLRNIRNGESSSEDGMLHDKTRKKKRLLVLSSAPIDERHILALWSELECFAHNVDKVIISAPKWGKDVIREVIRQAKRSIPRFVTGATSLEAEFYVNDRYDVGLWCDVLENQHLDDFDEFALLNDSIFALRKFSGVLDALDERNISMSSLSYSFSSPNFKSYGPEYFWLESVFRGFDRPGIDVFMKYSCVPVTHPFFCQKRKNWKACIINNFEHGMSRQFSRDQVGGLFPTDVPLEMITQERWNFRSWIQDVPFWRELVDTKGFPAAKVIVRDGSNGELITGPNDPMLRNCTRYLSLSTLKDLDYEKGNK
jgi:hypothetical protein